MKRAHLKQLRRSAKKQRAKARSEIQNAQLIELLNNYIPPIQIHIDLKPIFARLTREMMGVALMGEVAKQIQKSIASQRLSK